MTDTIEDVIQDVENLADKAVAKWEASPLGQLVDSQAKTAIAAIEKLSASDAEQAGLTIGEAALSGLATGGAAGAFAAGIAAAPAALKTAENQIESATVNTIVSAVVNDVQAQQAASTATTPAA